MDRSGPPTGPQGGASTAVVTALAWLAAAAPDPEACRRDWERSATGLLPLPAGRRWDVLLLPGLLGRPALRLLGRLGRPGPAFLEPGGGAPAPDAERLDPSGDRLGFLVPVGTAARWVGTGVRGVGAGARVSLPHPVLRGPGPRWLVLPDGSGRLTDPVALELALHEAAAGLEGPGEHL
ncbi:hypothetical protein [Kitasatospora sp. LaBMicrA B282]|uniref:hypothetical protein n=1 Tax=Kitasatospora sp. LaBMicrA B282 TaxID=3420949 RepID=UPI003D0CAF2C